MAVRLTYPNLAKDPTIREDVESRLAPLLQKIRDNRKGLDERNKRYYKMWNAEMDPATAGYTGNNKIYLAATRHVIETWVSSLTSQFHPSDDWWKINPVDAVTDQERADALSALEEHFLKKVMKVKWKNEKAFRQLCIYGTTVIKVAWKDEEHEVTFRKLKKLPLQKATTSTETKFVKKYYGPTYKVVDLANFYVYPETVDDVEDAQVVFEDMEVTVAHLRTMAARPMDEKHPDYGMIYELDPEILQSQNGFTEGSTLWEARQERLRRMGISNDPSVRWCDLSNDRRNLTEVYWKVDIGFGEKDYLLTFINDLYCIRIQENPFWRKTKPYFVPRLLTVVNEFYGRGLPEAVERVQAMMNSIANQTLDSLQYELNPITIVDPARVSYTQSIRFRPGMKWLADPQGIHFTQPSRVADMGLTALQSIQGWMHDFSGASAAMQGQPAVRGRGRSQNTASGMQTMLGQASAQIQTVIENLEVTLGAPLLRRVYELSEQFLDTPILLRIMGKKAGVLIEKDVNVEDVVGDYEFHWLGTSSMRNKMVLGQQMINFANIMRGFPPQVLQQINWQWLAEQIWKQGLGLRDSEMIFNPNATEPSVDPRVELLLMKEEREVEISPGDNHMEHLKQHMLDWNQEKNEKTLLLLNSHIQKTIMAIQQQAMQQQQMQQAQQQAMMQQMMEQQQKGGQKSEGPRPQNQPSGFGNGALAALGQQIQPGAGGQLQ